MPQDLRPDWRGLPYPSVGELTAEWRQTKIILRKSLLTFESVLHRITISKRE